MLSGAPAGSQKGQAPAAATSVFIKVIIIFPAAGEFGFAFNGARQLFQRTRSLFECSRRVASAARAISSPLLCPRWSGTLLDKQGVQAGDHFWQFTRGRRQCCPPHCGPRPKPSWFTFCTAPPSAAALQRRV